jgi:hypothetical protein
MPYIVEPVVGIEPTTCCLQNSATGFSSSNRHKRDRRFGLSNAFIDIPDLSMSNLY